MNIHDAALLMQEGRATTRRAWQDETHVVTMGVPVFGGRSFFKRTPLCIELWVPSAEDVLAEDWMVLSLQGRLAQMDAELAEDSAD